MPMPSDEWLANDPELARMIRSAEEGERQLRANDRQSWVDTIWAALHGYREDLIPEGEPMYDDEWSEITTAMAFITEALGLPTGADE